MPTPSHQIPPRTAWRDIIDAGKHTLKRADGRPLLWIETPPKSIDGLLKAVKKEPKAAVDTQPKPATPVASVEPILKQKVNGSIASRFKKKPVVEGPKTECQNV
jgi:hypothetical protein